MKDYYSLPLLFLLFFLVGLPNRLWGQTACGSRPVGADRYTAIDAGLLTSCNSVFNSTLSNAPANCYGNFFENSQGGQSSDEIFYKFTLGTQQKVTISHCGSGFDTFVSLLDVSGNVLAFADDTTKTTTTCAPNVASGTSTEAFMQRSLPPGTYYVVSEGFSANSGNITTRISVVVTPPQGATRANAIDAGTLNSRGALFSDKRSNAPATCYGNDFGQASHDIFYKFTLTTSTEVSIDHCLSKASNSIYGLDTYVSLLDGNGNLLTANDDQGPLCSGASASLKQTLAAGTYYVVSEGFSNVSGDITTRISTTSLSPVTVSPLNASIALGASTTLTASGASSYKWSPATGLNSTSASTVVATPTRTTTYTVTGTNGGVVQGSASVTVVVNTVPAAPSNPSEDRDRNWSLSRTYDLDGNIIGESKQFSDALGRATQSQVKNMAAKQVLATQTINSSGGQAVLSTLPAPINNQEFRYRADFVKSGSTSAPYTFADFEGSYASNPNVLDETTLGTLGYYYSPNNSWEPGTPATHNPYSLTEPYLRPSAGIRRAAGPGDELRMGSGREGREYNFRLLNELDQYTKLLPTVIPGSPNTFLRGKGTKSVSINSNGVESLSFTNQEGQVLANCLSGDQYPATTLTGNIDVHAYFGPVYQDIHIGTSSSPTLVTINGSQYGSSGFVLIDLKTDVQTSYSFAQNSGAQTLSLAPGFYRLNATIGNLTISYPVRYGNFSYIFYDAAGRAVATVAPNGLLGDNVLRNPGFEQDHTSTSNPTGWQNLTSPQGASYTQSTDFDVNIPSHSGGYFGIQWQSTGFTAYTSQVATGLPNGLYTLSAWVRSTGGATREMRAYHGTAAQRSVAIPNANQSEPWKKIELTNIAVTNGQCEIGFFTQTTAGGWTAFDDVSLVRQADNAAPTFITRNVYDTNSRLLSTTNPDDGTTRYVYARDGRIRFSQSARQVVEGKFSYSNYDEFGRVVESGEYQMANDRTKGVVFESSLNNPIQLKEAENATRMNVSTTTGVAGASGGGYVNSITQQGASSTTASSVTFTFTVPAAGAYTLEAQYASGDASVRTLSVYVNGTFSQQASFPGTSGTTNWNTHTLLLNLSAGNNNTVELRYGMPDNGGINLDYLRLLYSTTTSANSVLLPSILEDRTRSGGLDLSRCSQRNQVWYDQPFQDVQLNGRPQDFVLGGAAKTSKDGATTWYSYNDLGQLMWMVQERPVIGIKTLDYTYDAAANVLTVAYQQGQADAFYHHYQYDANQRLAIMQTSTDGANKTLQATYSYYLHGPLKRVEVAGNLQGIDYTYTVQGWLKSINNSQRNLDPGADGPNASGMFKDLFGMRLNYFNNDYRSKQQPSASNPTVAFNQNQPRYDGTIQAVSWHTAASTQTYGTSYLYDAKAQLLDTQFATVSGTAFTPVAGKANSEGNLSYDANGNMSSLRRVGSTGLVTDNFTYQYFSGTNRLQSVKNPAGTAVIDYDYDNTGQMTRQRDEQGQRFLSYDVTGKVTSIKVNATGLYSNLNPRQPLVTFTYDDRGFRSSKASYGPTGQLLRTTYYVRDLDGNEMSTYVQEATAPLQRTEVPLYGASRLGTLTSLDDKTVDPRYELNDQLGNARVVFHKPTTVKYVATLEQAAPSQDDQQFQNIPRRPDSSAPSGGQYVTATIGAPGPARSLSVEKGDTVTFSATVKGLTSATFLTTPKTSTVLLAVGAVGANSALPPPNGREGLFRPGNGLFQSLGRLGLGVSLTGLLSPHASQPAMQMGIGPPNINLHYKFYDVNNTLKAEGDEVIVTTTWTLLKIGFRAPEAGRLELSSGLVTGGEARFDDITYEQTGGMIVQEQHQYAYGSSLTGLSYTIGNKRYRHGYQSEYAEKDEETGYDSFELRMYNSRIGRWMAPDPEGQFHSPFVGMGNNPVLNTDPNGGWMFSVTGAIFGAAIGGVAGSFIDPKNGWWKGAIAGAAIGGVVGGIGDVKTEYQQVGEGHRWNSLRKDIGIEGKTGPNNAFIKGTSGRYSGELVTIKALKNVPTGAAGGSSITIPPLSFINTTSFNGAGSEPGPKSYATTQSIIDLYRGSNKMASYSADDPLPLGTKMNGDAMTGVFRVLNPPVNQDGSVLTRASTGIRVTLEVHRMPFSRIRELGTGFRTPNQMHHETLRRKRIDAKRASLGLPSIEWPR